MYFSGLGSNLYLDSFIKEIWLKGKYSVLLVSYLSFLVLNKWTKHVDMTQTHRYLWEVTCKKSASTRTLVKVANKAGKLTKQVDQERQVEWWGRQAESHFNCHYFRPNFCCLSYLSGTCLISKKLEEKLYKIQKFSSVINETYFWSWDTFHWDTTGVKFWPN